MPPRERTLVQLARLCEETASGLHAFRDSLPRYAALVTDIIAEFFAISSILLRLDIAEGDVRYQPSFYRIRDDVGLVIGSLKASIDDILDMFSRSAGRPRQMVWEDLQHQMDDEEGESLLDRLQLYKDFLTGQAAVLAGRRVSGLREARHRIQNLIHGQETSRPPATVPASSGPSTPRPRTSRPGEPYMASPTSTNSVPGIWDERPPPAPDPPLASPTFTSSSSRTMNSSWTSYSNEPRSPTGAIHWAQDIFDGSNPMTPFRMAYMVTANSACHGSPDPSALYQLDQDRFTKLLQQTFDNQGLIVSLLWRSYDGRARIHIVDWNAGTAVHFCKTLTTLKAFRKGTCLQLCQALDDNRYRLWCKLNFATYERMVLFYCTFVAMKHQDQRGIPDTRLLDSFQLQEGERGEELRFSGVIAHGGLTLALRLFRDRASNGVRLEATFHRGSRKNVPIWTAFVTTYAERGDEAWPEYEGDGLVSMAALRPPPYIFSGEYEPPRNTRGEYILPFVSPDDGKQFVESWVGLCRSHARGA